MINGDTNHLLEESVITNEQRASTGACRGVSRRRWFGWAIGAFYFIFDVGLRLSIDVVNSDLQSEFDIGASELSSIGATFFYAYAACQVGRGV